MAVIVRLEAVAARAPVERPVATSFGVMRDRPAVFLKAEDADGAFGWGEIFANWPAAGAEHRVNLLADDLAPLILGAPVEDPPALFAELTARTHVRALQCGEFGPFRQCLAGLDQALWDLAARRAGRPLRQRLDPGAADAVAAYASGIHVDAAESVIPAARAAGFSAFKVKIGFDPVRDAARIREIAGGLGHGERLFLDANQGWTEPEARAFLGAVADLPLGWLEEPVAADRPAAEWRRLAGRLPLAGGENLAGRRAFAAAPLDIVQPDLAKWGGVSGCLQVALDALAAGRTYCPHFLGGGIGLAASAELLAAAGGPGLLEVDVNPNPLRDLLCDPADHVSKGTWRLDAGGPFSATALPAETDAFVTHRRMAVPG